MYRGFGNMGSNMLIVWIIPIILTVLIGIAVYMIVNNKRGYNKTESKSALEILNERYAKGEIDEEEYIKKKKDLTSF